MLIKMHGLEKTYQQSDVISSTVLKSLAFAIDQGEFVAIMGPSGSGKTTLMNIIGTLDHPTGGSYWLAGEEVSAVGDAALARLRNRTIGFVFQQFNLLPRRTVAENIALPLLYAGVAYAEAIERAQKMLTRVGLLSHANYFPTQLSGGQQQRIAIARALVTEPKLLLADEPTGNLDSKTSDEVMDLFVELHGQGITVVLVTHEQEIADYAKRLIQIKDGHIIYDGPVVNSAALSEGH